MTEVKSLYDIGFEHGYAQAKEDIVHCKNCVHRTENTSTWCRWYIYRNGNIDSLDDYKPDENDYCSKGERKDEVEK